MRLSEVIKIKFRFQEAGLASQIDYIGDGAIKLIIVDSEIRVVGELLSEYKMQK